MAVILYRFAVFLGAHPAVYENTQLTYTDSADISPWAVDAAKIAGKPELLKGVTTAVSRRKELQHG